MTDLRRLIEAAYLLGFNSAGQGYNGEYPFSDKGRNPEEMPPPYCFIRVFWKNTGKSGLRPGLGRETGKTALPTPRDMGYTARVSGCPRVVPQWGEPRDIWPGTKRLMIACDGMKPKGRVERPQPGNNWPPRPRNQTRRAAHKPPSGVPLRQCGKD